MVDAESVPDDDVGVVEAFVRVGGDPSGEAGRGGAGGLGDVAAGWVELVVCVLGGMSAVGYGWRGRNGRGKG